MKRLTKDDVLAQYGDVQFHNSLTGDEKGSLHFFGVLPCGTKVFARANVAGDDAAKAYQGTPAEWPGASWPLHEIVANLGLAHFHHWDYGSANMVARFDAEATQ